MRQLGAEGFPWHNPDRRSPEHDQRLRHLARRLIWRAWPAPARFIAALAAIILWPIRSRADTRRLINAANVDALPPGMFWSAWGAALRHNIPPAEFGGFGIPETAHTGADHWLFTREASLLSAHLTSKSVSDLCGDKVRFAEFCSRNGSLSVVSPLAVISANKFSQAFDGDTPPTRDLVVKPVRNSQGRRCELWTYRDGGHVRQNDGKTFLANNFIDHLRATSDTDPGGLVVQAYVPPHPGLSPLAELGPPVARIVTGRWPDHRVELIDAMIQKPRADGWLTHGGPIRLIDHETGRFCDRRPGPHVFPDLTDDPVFDGLKLERWSDCVPGLCALHKMIPDQAPLIGWDVIFSPDGPVVLEANTTLAPFFFQVARQATAADGRWSELLASYLP
ncbi:MAG: sugar-transfer associated ATP-grasp domain-containing protein [Pseudomonadota bacterium]